MTRGRAETVRLEADSARLGDLVRALAASVNVRLLGALAEERRRRGDDAWLTLSEAAARIGEAPGTVSAVVGKLQLAGLVEEKREKGRRWFRSRVKDLELRLL